MPRWRSERRLSRRSALLGAALTLAPVAAGAQAPAPRGGASADVAPYLPTLLVATAAPQPGRESTSSLADALVKAGWTRDAMGNFTLRRGSGTPRRVVACALDQPGYVVGEITDDGYLRLHAPADPRRHPLWDQFHEGQRVLVDAGLRELPGVVAVRSTHLWRRRPAQEAPTTVDELWVDVGARSRRDVERLGIEVLAPVRREFRVWRYGADTVLAAGGMAARVGCAAVAAVAGRGAPPAGETVYVLSAQSAFGWTGLSAALARLPKVDTVVVVDAGMARGTSGADSATGAESVTARPVRPAFALPASARGAAVVAAGVRTTFPGTLVEGVTWGDARALAERLATLAGLPAPDADARRRGIFADAIDAVQDRPPADSLKEVADLLAHLTDVYAVSGHEGRMRDAVLAALPAWARASTRADSAGNLVLGIGPNRDTVAFVAHLDEIGFEVTKIAHDGVVSLRPRGGFYLSLWEGQPALLHYETDAEAARLTRAGGCRLVARPGALSGVFVPRQTATTKQPAEATAWFGTDSAGLAACGVRPGMAVTGVKSAARLAGTRFTARSIDDRAGCTALIMALREIDPARLTHKVIFAWSVREETALGGAAALAATLGPTVKRVHAVDTFVSADSPLESHRFAYAPLGAGAVVRALDNSSATPPAEVDRVTRIARASGIPLQVGTTNGGNDGSELARYGAVDVPIGWPLRYSHSPAEVIDLVDVRSLGRLVAALAKEK